MPYKLGADGKYVWVNGNNSSNNNSSGSNNGTSSIVNNTADTKDEVSAVKENASAKTRANVFGRGTAKGNHRIRKGKKVGIVGTSKHFEGVYGVIGTTHTITTAGYTTEFVVGIIESVKDVSTGNGVTSNNNGVTNSSEGTANGGSSSNGSSSSNGYVWVLGPDGNYHKKKK